MIKNIFNEVYKKKIPEKIGLMNKDKFRETEDIDDYIQEMYLILLSIDDKKIKDLYEEKKLEDYFAKICYNQLNNTKSTYNTLMENNILKCEYLEENYDIE